MSGEPIIDRTALDRLRRIGGEKLLRKMVALFLESGPERLRAVTECAAAGDVSGVERAVHGMKSSAGNVGAIRLQRTAEAIEARAVAGSIDGGSVQRLTGDYDDSAAELRRVLTEET
ncbi:MAG TPA: Hpt domain-containing protein [Longimicrobiales bacterium]|nr:Hpt domain-containing protein [Longimicrobiales bacterium]